ncbi:MAG: hypothetical protein H7281_15770 [Bacteriovorax sp.]|nr:hypothetical protein [Bacteriovorax sp.]
MKLRFKYSLQITLTASLLLLGSCGKKNTVNSSVGASGTSPFYVGNSAVSSTIVNQVQSVRSSVTCLSGRNRLANDVSFYINSGSISGTTIGGNWQLGFMNTGTISNLYIGVSAYRDLMFVTKVTNGGSQVIGYNVTLSFCEVPNAYVNYPALVSNDRALVNFQAGNGIVLDTNTYCGYGVVDAAINTLIVSQKSTTNPYTSDYPVYTSFTKPSCNGQF